MARLRATSVGVPWVAGRDWLRLLGVKWTRQRRRGVVDLPALDAIPLRPGLRVNLAYQVAAAFATAL